MDNRWSMPYIKSAEEIIAGIANEIRFSRTGTQSSLELGASKMSSTERESPIAPNRTVSTTRSMAVDVILKLDFCLLGPETVIAWSVFTPAEHDKSVNMIRAQSHLNSSAVVYNIVPDADSHHANVPQHVFTLRIEQHVWTDDSTRVERMALVTPHTEGDAITTHTHGKHHEQRS